MRKSKAKLTAWVCPDAKCSGTWKWQKNEAKSCNRCGRKLVNVKVSSRGTLATNF